jgi:hypothetical protein
MKNETKYLVERFYPFKIKIINQDKWFNKSNVLTFIMARHQKALLSVSYYSKRNRHNERKKLIKYKNEVKSIKDQYPEYFI